MYHDSSGHHGLDAGPPVKKPRGGRPMAGGPFSHVGSMSHRDPEPSPLFVERFLERQDAGLAPNSIIHMSILQPSYPINVEVLYKVCSLMGRVRKIICFEKNKWMQAMIEFDTLESACKAREALHGCDIYSGCCTMKVEFSKLQTLHVKENGPTSWDFESNSVLGSGPGGGAHKRKSVLTAPDEMMRGGGGPGAAGSFMPGMMPSGGSGGMRGKMEAGDRGMGQTFGNLASGMSGNFSGFGGGFGGGSASVGMGSTQSGGSLFGRPGFPSPQQQQAAAAQAVLSGLGGFLGGAAGNPSDMSRVRGNPGAGGGGGGGSLFGVHSGNPSDMSLINQILMEGGSGGSGGSCVLLVYGLEPPKWNCSRLFNLLCQYGNVVQLFFIRAKPNTAMVEMGSPEMVDTVIRNLRDNVNIWGEQLRFEVSKKHQHINNLPPEFELPDGSPSRLTQVKIGDLNRFLVPELASKNRIVRPSKVLHFFAAPRITETDLENLFEDEGAPVPHQVKFVSKQQQSDSSKQSGVGLAYFNSVEDATEAIVLVNHAKIGNKHIKLCYSPAKY